MKSKKVFRYIIILVVLAVVVFIIGKKKGWFGNEYRIEVAVEKGAKRDIIEIITANGKIKPETEVKLSPDVSGEIVELNVKEGDIVQKGQLLLKIKPDNYISVRNRIEATLNSTKARLTQADAQLNQAKLEFTRKTKLWDQRAISEAEYELAHTSYNTSLAEKEASEYSVTSAEASLKEAEENLRKTSIYAPMNGTVSMLNVELGERVVGTELMTGTELMRIANLDRMEVVVDVNENDIVRLSKNDTALIEVDAYLGRKFKGIVTEIPISANTTGLATDQVTNFNVKILLLKESYSDLSEKNIISPFRPGMSATADIQTSRKIGVFSVPIQAVTTRPDSTGELNDSTKMSKDGTIVREEEIMVVFINKGDTAKLVRVETGIQDDKYIEIFSGPQEGDEIITDPYSAVSKKIKNNALIKVVDKKDLFTGNKKK